MQQTIPENLYKYFWEAEPNNINIENHSSYIISRLVNVGNIDSLKWIFTAYSPSHIKEVIRNSRQLTAKSANFISLLLTIPTKEIRCLQPEFQKTHNQSWNR